MMIHFAISSLVLATSLFYSTLVKVEFNTLWTKNRVILKLFAECMGLC